MQKCLLFFILSFLAPSIYQPSYGQSFIRSTESLVLDSWTNAGHWFTRPTEIKNSALIGLGAVSLISTTMAWEAQIQPKLALGNPSQSSFFSQVSEPFGHPIKMGVLALSTYYAAGFFKNQKVQGASSAALQAMLTGGIAVMSLKLLTHRVRPAEQDIFDPYQFKGASFARDNLSFPSGHATIAFALASSLSSYYEYDLRLAIPLFAIASATAFQRVYDFQHWPSDVLAGAFLGSWIGNKIGKWQREKNSPLRLTIASNPWGAVSFQASLKLD